MYYVQSLALCYMERVVITFPPKVACWRVTVDSVYKKEQEQVTSCSSCLRTEEFPRMWDFQC